MSKDAKSLTRNWKVKFNQRKPGWWSEVVPFKALSKLKGISFWIQTMLISECFLLYRKLESQTTKCYVHHGYNLIVIELLFKDVLLSLLAGKQKLEIKFVYIQASYLWFWLCNYLDICSLWHPVFKFTFVSALQYNIISVMYLQKLKQVIASYSSN